MSAIAQALSAALVDFIWQGALVGVLLWVALAALRRSSPNARYAASCVALTALVLLPVITLLTLMARAVPLDASATLPAVAPAVTVSTPQTMLPIWLVSDEPRIDWLATVQAWAVPIWSLGVVLFSVRLVFGCTHAFTLGRRGTVADESVRGVVDVLARRMGIDRHIRVLVSSLAEGPSVVGWLRPAILLPPATAMGLTPQQLEAVLAHELAHVKRHDYLVNVLQIVAETLFFYHPVVWWTSKQMRLERELCCDDLAVRSSGDAVGYARALTTLARLQLSTPATTMAATGGSLVHRVQRLVGAVPSEYGPSGWAGLLALGLVVGCGALNLDRLQAFAGAQAADMPRFEVASVKRNTRNDGQIMDRRQGDRYVVTGASLAVLIRSAYQVQEFQIVGGPKWLEADRFDIVARMAPAVSGSDSVRAPDGPTRQELMLRALLEDRFGLRVHKEVREMPIYALVLARSDGRLGPQLRPSPVDCDAVAAARRAGGPPVGTPDGPVCGTSVGPGVVLAGDRTIAQLATALSRLSNAGMSLHRVVVDRTGLTGNFDVELRFAPQELGAVGPQGFVLDPPVQEGASIFTAVQEQLGLKLEPQRGPVEVLVIDRADPPTED